MAGRDPPWGSSLELTMQPPNEQLNYDGPPCCLCLAVREVHFVFETVEEVLGVLEIVSTIFLDIGLQLVLKVLAGAADTPVGFRITWTTCYRSHSVQCFQFRAAFAYRVSSNTIGQLM